MQAILLVGHGTRNTTGQQQFLRLAEHLRAAVAPWPLEVAYIELQSPSIEEALLRMHGQGIKNVILSPALLFAAGHAKQDIPEAVNRAKQIASDLEVTCAEPLGCHEALLELAALRFQDSLSSVLRGEGRGEGPAQQVDTTSALVLIGRGSSDLIAIEHCQEFATKLASDLRIEKVFTGFIAIAQPSLPAALEQAAASGARQIVVQSHLLFSGEMLETTAAAVAEMKQRYPFLAWRQADCLGADLLATDSLAAVLLVQALRSRLTFLPR